MKKSLLILGVFLCVVLLLAGLAAGSAYWIARRALPQLDGEASLPELKQAVTVNRDAWGVPRIRAQSVEDLVTAQGYVVAQDRLWQMDFLRRAAAGELAEIFGQVALTYDRETRILGLRVAAEKELTRLNGEQRALLDAYARGVNRYIAERRGRLPWEFLALRYEPRPWTPVDSLLIGGHMFRTLTTTWEWELSRAKATAKIGAERGRELFTVDSSRDHFVVGAGEAAARKGPAATSLAAPDWQGAQTLLARFAEESEAFFGSNNWVVDGRHTYSGKPILANDTHLPLDVPCIWYMAHLQAPGWNVKGFTLPGVPLVILGHNERIAWGFTNNGADVQDLYLETFNPANLHEYRHNGAWVRAEVRKEIIRIKGRAEHALDVVVTRHGPIVHREAGRAYALRWVALEPGGLSFVYPMIGSAKNWTEFLDVMRLIQGPAQNTVYADVDGNIGYVVAARIPVRKNFDGTVPVPGERDEFEWAGYIPFDQMPQVLNPPEGIIATANARVVGANYKPYLTDRWAGPHRTERIYELLHSGAHFRPEDFIRIQADIVSLPHKMLAEYLVRASEKARPKDARAAELLARLKGWDGQASVDSVETSFVEFTRRALMRNLLRPHFGDAYARLYEWWRHIVFLENVLRDRPAHWLPKPYANYDELLIASAEDAVKRMERDSRESAPSAWRWGRFMQLEILHPIGRDGLLRSLLSIGPLPQPGTSHSVKQTTRTFGPSQRFVADLSNWDHSLMNLTAGQSGQIFSSHYRDHFPAWFEGRGLPSAFSDAAWEKTSQHRLLLQPGANPR